MRYQFDTECRGAVSCFHYCQPVSSVRRAADYCVGYITITFDKINKLNHFFFFFFCIVKLLCFKIHFGPRFYLFTFFNA